MPSNRPLFMQHFLKRLSASARARVVAAELLDEILVAVDDSVAAFYGRFGRETLSDACSSARKQPSSSKSFIWCMMHLQPAVPARRNTNVREWNGLPEWTTGRQAQRDISGRVRPSRGVTMRVVLVWQP
jgi:hypothetical protein